MSKSLNKFSWNLLIINEISVCVFVSLAANSSFMIRSWATELGTQVHFSPRWVLVILDFMTSCSSCYLATNGAKMTDFCIHTLTTLYQSFLSLIFIVFTTITAHLCAGHLNYTCQATTSCSNRRTSNIYVCAGSWVLRGWGKKRDWTSLGLWTCSPSHPRGFFRSKPTGKESEVTNPQWEPS